MNSVVFMSFMKGILTLITIATNTESMINAFNMAIFQMKPNSVESCNELHNQLNTQINSQKSMPMNQESEMVQPIQKFPFVNNINMYSTQANLINANTMNPTRFAGRKLMYQSNIEPRPSSTCLFDGFITINDEYRTELRISVDQSANLKCGSFTNTLDFMCFSFIF